MNDSADDNRNTDRTAPGGSSRREFIQSGIFGLAVLIEGQLHLKASAYPTESSGGLGSYGDYLIEEGRRGAAKSPASRAQPAKVSRTPPPISATRTMKITEDNILGPFYREGAPFRGKITPPLSPGKVVLVKGRVYGFDSRKPLANGVIDIWQASESGRYDNDDPSKPPKSNVFINRARLCTDENGYYEYETIHPGRYRIGPKTWRPSHIHYLVRCPGYKTLITQLYFEGDPHNSTDQFIKKSLIVRFAERRVDSQSYEEGIFDIVLARA